MPEILCPWEPSTLLFFSTNVPPLVHYSHAVALLSALGIGIVLFINDRRNIVTRLFLLFVALFSIWTALDVILWATNRPDVVMFSWSLQILLEPLTYTVAFYLFYIFVAKRLPSIGINIAIGLLLLPLIVLLPTTYNLEALGLASCEAFEGPLAKYYTYIVHSILLLGILTVGVFKIRQLPTTRERSIAILFGIGLALFLLTFSSGNIISSFTDDWTISQYGLFGMPILAGFIAYSIVQFKAFNAKVIASQMLVGFLALAIIAIATLQDIAYVRIVAGVTFLLVCFLGFELVRSVEREIEQRQRIEALARELTAANERQVSLIHFITHQIKGFVTKSRNIFSMLLEGDFGVLPETMKPMIQQGFESDTHGVATIQEILNASNIKSGKVSYVMSPMDLKALIEQIAGDLRPTAERKNLKLEMHLTPEPLSINGDAAQLVNAFKNLVDNSIKYTPQGLVSLTLEHKEGKAVFTATDTGVGITPEDMHNLFTEGGHGKESIRVNAESTGFGLYIVKNIIEAHKGKVWAESDGPGKGSRFIIELPALA